MHIVVSRRYNSLYLMRDLWLLICHADMKNEFGNGTLRMKRWQISQKTGDLSITSFPQF